MPFWRTIVVIFILGLIVPGVFALFFSYPVSGPDSVQYDRLGINLSQGHGFSLEDSSPFTRTMFREPGYPVFLAFIYTIFGHKIWVAVFIQIVLHALTAVITYLTAKEIFSERIAAVSGVVVALFPTLANMAGYILSETFFTFLLSLAMYIFLKCIKIEKLSWFMILGVIMGAAILTKVVTLFLPIALAGMILLIFMDKHKKLFKIIAYLAIFITITYSITAFWLVRNKNNFNVVALTLRGGEALWSRAEKLDDSPRELAATALYSVSEALGHKIFPDVTDKPERYLFKDFDRAEELRRQHKKDGLTDIQVENIFKTEAIDKIKARPLAYIGYTFIEGIKMTAFTYIPFLNESKVQKSFKGLRGGSIILSAVKGADRLIAYILILGFFIAIMRNWPLADRWWPLALVVIYFNVIYSMLDAIGRYAIPLIPFYCIFFFSIFGKGNSRCQKV